MVMTSTSPDMFPDLDAEKSEGSTIHLENTEILQPTKEELQRVYRKVDRRILLFVALTYFLCYLDRSNIGNAKVLSNNTSDDLMSSIHMNDHQYRIGLMLFLVSYSLFEAPSNLAMKIFSPPRWLGFLVFCFGSLCAGIGGCQNVPTLMALRFLLGAAEAGVYPGMIFYLAFWYGPRERAIRIAVFLCSATLAGSFGGVIAYGVGHMNRASGLEAWRWLFIIEGAPCVLLAILIFFFLPSYPDKVTWLSPEEKATLVSSYGANIPRGDDKLNWTDAKATLKDVWLWMHYVIYLCVGIGVSSLSLFSPTIIEALGYKGLNAQLFTIPPYACAYVVTLASSYLSDRYKTRGLVAAAFSLLGLITFLIPACVSSPSLHLRYAMLVLSTIASFGGLPSLCAWVSDNVHNTTASSLASGLNIAFTGPGQIIGVWIYQSQQVPRYQTGHAVNAASQGLALVLTLGLRWHYLRKNARLGPGEQKFVA